MNGIKSLAVATMLASSVPAGSQVPESDVQAQISEVLINEENSDNQNTLPSEDIMIRLQVEEQLNTFVNVFIGDNRFTKLVKFYGEDGVRSKIYEMIDRVCKNPDKYGIFDSKGNFALTEEDGYSLYASIFPEYVLEAKTNKDEAVAIALVYVLFVVLCGGWVLNTSLTEYKLKLQSLQKEYDSLQKKYAELNESSK